MTDKKNELTTDVLLADLMLRITAIEKLLIDKKSFSQEELAKTTDEIAQKVAKIVLDKAQAAKNMEELISDLSQSKKNLKN